MNSRRSNQRDPSPLSAQMFQSNLGRFLEGGFLMGMMGVTCMGDVFFGRIFVAFFCLWDVSVLKNYSIEANRYCADLVDQTLVVYAS